MVQENVDSMVKEIVDFVRQYQESTASIAVCRRMLGSYPGRIDQKMLSELQKRLRSAEPDELESCYYIIK